MESLFSYVIKYIKNREIKYINEGCEIIRGMMAKHAISDKQYRSMNKPSIERLSSVLPLNSYRKECIKVYTFLGQFFGVIVTGIVHLMFEGTSKNLHIKGICDYHIKYPEERIDEILHILFDHFEDTVASEYSLCLMPGIGDVNVYVSSLRDFIFIND